MNVDWKTELVEQIDLHWQSQLRPRLDGLTDDEYFWEPVPGAWNVRPRGEGDAPIKAGAGDFTIDFAMPEPDPVPVTTISWRLGHILVGVLGARVHAHFGGPPVDYFTFDYPGTAADALRRLDKFYAAWHDGVAGLESDAFGEPVGPAEGDWADSPMATLVLHINRELIHHGAEIALLRDLYAWRTEAGR